MKVFISADMEGVTGIVDPSFINPHTGKNYQMGRRLMTSDVNAVIEAALDVGATEILVADSHTHMNNILIEELHPKAQLLCGSPRDFSMMQGLDSSFDAALFVGYHARQGMPGVLSHTMSGVVRNIFINDTLVGEFGFNAIYASLCGVPVCFVSGDQYIALEADDLIPGISAAIVKKAVSRTSAICLTPRESAEILKEKAKQALILKKDIPLIQVEVPLTLKMEFAHTGQAEMAAIIPKAEYCSASTVVSLVVHDQFELYRGMRAMLNLAGTAQFD